MGSRGSKEQNLSDETKIANVKWANLKKFAMKYNYKNLPMFVSNCKPKSLKKMSILA